MTQNKTTYKNPQTKQQARIEYITENMLYMTQDQMAEELHVSRKTICRDLTTWYDNKGFKDFIIGQFIENYGKAKREEKPIKLLDRIITMFKYLPPEDTQQALNEIKLSLDDSYIVEKAKEIEAACNQHDNSVIVEDNKGDSIDNTVIDDGADSITDNSVSNANTKRK